MLINFLTDKQNQTYARYPDNLSQEQLDKYFYLDDKDRELINVCRHDYNKLGYALQLTTDQGAGFHGIVITGTIRDSLYLLDGMQDQQTSLELKEIMTDTASASEIIFALFWLLGYQFSPRLADIGKTRFWRIA